MTLISRSVSLVRRLGLESPARRALTNTRSAVATCRRLVQAILNGTHKTAATIRRLPEQCRRTRAYRDLLRGPIVFEELVGTPSSTAVAVIVCLWNRPERLADILGILSSQTTESTIRLVLWNNQPDHSAQYRRAIDEFTPTEMLNSVEFVESPHNIGGMGRFLAARELVARGYTGAYIMMDDDQNFGPTFVSDLLAAATPRSVRGVWAWTNDGAYWNRTQLEATGQLADHIGTGGCVCDSAIVNDPEFFHSIPPRFLFMEDIWMSRYAAHSGWTLAMVESPFSFVLSERDQGHALFDRKEDFFDWLSIPGHIPTRPASRS
ncbi:glycosyltransferase family 2 protein [Lacisediminihabitans changchengi]|uniref:Glycosyltransferase n=1 Tax=Lacisediminihabitans changchengi TaxID=2787634 RepID=A0A934SNQ2_9MICO|nr:hypothetical protein [Lacisediminihabitans changchengi]MBK4346474.1 hypothetical protein [Lacisediminihabitans changchengi]MBK4348898.1 hypothetical protein [Lacisediminihabitans changchengi]